MSGRKGAEASSFFFVLRFESDGIVILFRVRARDSFPAAPVLMDQIHFYASF